MDAEPEGDVQDRETHATGDGSGAGHVGFVLNTTYVSSDGRPVVHLHGRLQDGRAFLVRDTRQTPHFYIESADAERAAAHGARRLVATDRRTMTGEPVHRVELHRPQEAPPLRSRLQSHGLRTYEADVRFAYRYLIDRGIQSAVRIIGEPQPWRGVPATFTDPELQPAEWKPQLSVLSLDIETSPDAAALLSVALWGCGAQEVLLLCADGAECPAGAVPFATEAELLRGLCRRVRELDPDVIAGWNIIDFDIPVLIRLAAAAGVPLEMGRGPGALRQRDDGQRRFTDSVFIPGRVLLDGIRLLRAVSLRLERYTLEAAAQAILGEGKTMSGHGRVDQIMESFANDRTGFVAYSLTDARLVWEILDKLQLVAFTVERSRLTGMPPDRVGSSIAAFDFLYLSRLHPRDVVAPSVGTPAAPGDELDAPTYGGHVLEPRPGLHDDVLVFDFKSLYPSIIRTFQIDPLGLLPGTGRCPAPALEDGDEPSAVVPAPAAEPARAADPAPAESTAGDEAIVAPNGARFGRATGILTGMLDDLFASRDQAKRAGDGVASNAIKILMNSFYGVLGTPSCRFHNPRLANAITSFGKHLLLWARQWMQQHEREVLYGDTDSLFVAAALSGDAADADGQALATALNRDLATYIAATWQVESRLELEFERRFERLFLPPLRGSSRGASKRYVGMVGGELSFTGMEVVRRDWTDLAHEVQRELYRRLFADQPVDAYLRAVIEQVAAGERDAQLVYHKGLRKAAGDYRAVPPHVAAARKRQGSASVDDDRGVIDYVITREGPEPWEEAVNPLDYEHYIERQIRPVAEPVLAVMQLNFDEVRLGVRQLELF